ncbi:hypothetical protein [Microtetraspora sp. NBRC 16547]|uniref:hypothetical protein n=1 Tax=Microtetraspora sp. NBRC 16547 TaxID=3030993 RepID=UPI0024A49C1B|nr:hypothetical protein [Microtetraspora sp. NBRC 16547]GLW97726.1 hypothetical protein Misp02_18130 [Microtetraspora sp. NBRC 16547]
MTLVLGPDDPIDLEWAPADSMTEVSDLVRAGRTVVVTLPDDPTEAVAAAAVFAWAGARVFRATPETARDVRLAVEMTESLAGRRPPALTRRGLA